MELRKGLWRRRITHAVERERMEQLLSDYEKLDDIIWNIDLLKELTNAGVEK